MSSIKKFLTVKQTLVQTFLGFMSTGQNTPGVIPTSRAAEQELRFDEKKTRQDSYYRHYHSVCVCFGLVCAV